MSKNIKIEKKIDASQKCLFICTTPLQIVIANSIFNNELKNKKKFDFVLIPLSSSEKYLFYYKKFARFSCDSYFLDDLSLFPFYAFQLKKIFKNKSYSKVFLASIDSIHIHFILSYCNFDKLYTFDDGSASISKLGFSANIKSDIREIFKKLLRSLLGNNYSAKKILINTLNHYTLYPDSLVCKKNLKYINFFNASDNPQKLKNTKAVVIVGPVFNEIIKKTICKINLLNLISVFVKKINNNNVIYLPHYRDETSLIADVETVKSIMISEDVIISMLNDFEEIDVYGFSSSVQFNLLNIKTVNNYVFVSKYLKDSVNDLGGILKDCGANQINLDTAVI